MKTILSALAFGLMVASSMVSGTAEAQNLAVPISPNRFELPALKFTPDALSPVIGAQTMQIHYGKHHKAYVDALNKAVAETPALQGKSLDEIIATISAYPMVVRNNAGGHWNHSFFWESLCAPKDSGQPSKALMKAIVTQFGSFENFKSEFKKAGTGRFGSGWVWLIITKDGHLTISSTPYQDNPLMDIAETKGTPILGNDVWEHAYYLDYQNRRADYLEAYWAVVDWAVVSKRFAAH